MPFVKRQSGNPAGCPLGSRLVQAINRMADRLDRVLDAFERRQGCGERHQRV